MEILNSRLHKLRMASLFTWLRLAYPGNLQVYLHCGLGFIGVSQKLSHAGDQTMETYSRSNLIETVNAYSSVATSLSIKHCLKS